MPKKTLDVKPMQQQYDNSCWAACIRMVLFYDKLILTSDETLAKKLNVLVNECQNIAVQMDHCNIYEATDDEALIAPFEDIMSEIDKGRPIIQCVNEKQIKRGASSDEGHYILIIGYDDKDKTITIIDPGSSNILEVKHNIPSVTINGCRRYYAQPYYTKKGTPF